jgi:hypothetical protein
MQTLATAGIHQICEVAFSGESGKCAPASVVDPKEPTKLGIVKETVGDQALL